LTLLEEGVSVVVRGAENSINTYVLLVGKEDENRGLIRKISELEQENNSYAEAVRENERLKKILQLSSERSDYITTAKVIARDPTNWFQTLSINKGKKEGIAKDMVAVASAGPVGRIHRVFDGGAGIILITDVNSSVAVRLQKSRIEGILEGRGDNTCYLKYISKEVNVEAGEKLITSGLDGIYPRGLLIGYVSNVIKEGEEMFQEIEVSPLQNLSSVEEVAILGK
jgi:rod shape-determining protein MreC